MIHPKVAGAAIASAVAAIIIVILVQSGVTVTPELEGAILTLATAIGGYFPASPPAPPAPPVVFPPPTP